MRFLTLITTMIIGFPAFAINIDLGEASKYNAFVRGDFSVTSSDTEGRIAVGGDFNVNGGYDIGTHIIDYNMGDGPTLVVGGDINKSGPGALNIYESATLPNMIHGDLVYGGAVNQTGGSIEVRDQTQGEHVDFDSAFTHLEALSETLAESTNGTTSTDLSWKLDFTPDVANPPTDNIYVFDVSQEMFKTKWGGNRTDWHLSTEGMADDAVVVFNINGNGGVVDFTQANIFLHDGSDKHSTADPLSGYFNKGSANANPPIRVLYNFYDASVINVTLNLESDLYGSILAPTANIAAPESVIWGQVIANSWEGNMQINYNPFNPEDVSSVSVPTPSVFWSFSLAFLVIFAKQKMVRKSRQSALTIA